MKQTTNYNLNQIELNDTPADITVINPNWDKIDTELKAHADVLPTLAPLNSPSLIGTPTTPTAKSGDSSKVIANTEFVTSVCNTLSNSISNKLSKTISVTNANLNTLLGDQGYYCVGTLTNAPVSCTQCYLQVMNQGDDNTGVSVQMCYIPQTDNTLKVYVRNYNGSVFGAWEELIRSTEFNRAREQIKYLYDEDKFRSLSLMRGINHALLWLMVECYDTLVDVDNTKGNYNDVVSFWDKDLNVINKTGTNSIVFYSVVKVVTQSNNYIYILADYEGSGTVKLEVSRNNGSSYTTVTNDAITNISSQSSGSTMILKVTLTGQVVFKNVFWGCK